MPEANGHPDIWNMAEEAVLDEITKLRRRAGALERAYRTTGNARPCSVAAAIFREAADEMGAKLERFDAAKGKG